MSGVKLHNFWIKYGRMRRFFLFLFLRSIPPRMVLPNLISYVVFLRSKLENKREI